MNFDTIQDYINKANEFRELLKDCGNPVKDDKLIHHILKRLPSVYASFVSSYNTHRLTMGSAFQKPTFDAFAEMLIFEQSHLIDMILLTSSKTKALMIVMRTNQVKEEKVLTIARKISGRKNHNLRHNNPPHNKVVLLPTRRETMKRRTNFFVHIAKSQS